MTNLTKKKENWDVLFICDVLRSVDSLTFSSKFVVVHRGLSIGNQQVLYSEVPCLRGDQLEIAIK